MFFFSYFTSIPGGWFYESREIRGSRCTAHKVLRPPSAAAGSWGSWMPNSQDDRIDPAYGRIYSIVADMRPSAPYKKLTQMHLCTGVMHTENVLRLALGKWSKGKICMRSIPAPQSLSWRDANSLMQILSDISTRITATQHSLSRRHANNSMQILLRLSPR